MTRTEGLRTFLRENGVAVCAAVLALALLAQGVRWIAMHRDAPPPKRVVTITGVLLKPPEPLKPPPAPPPPPVSRIKPMEEPQRTRVEIKAADIPPPSAPPPPQSAPGGGRLSLAAEAGAEGDAFNLAGNPGGRSILSGGGLGDGTGTGIGSGDGEGGRYGWYYARLASEIEEAFRKSKRLTTASARVELRIWAEPSGRITRVELIRSTGNSELDEDIRSIVGLHLREPPPADIPMPMLARFTARRPR